MFIARILEGGKPWVVPIDATARRSWGIKGGGGAAIDVSSHVAIANAKIVLEQQRMLREAIQNRCKLSA